MLGDSSIDDALLSRVLVCSERKLTTAWLVAKFPAVVSKICRSPGTPHVKVLGYREILSRPPFVRVSDINTSPRDNFRATQYDNGYEPQLLLADHYSCGDLFFTISKPNT